MSNEEDLDLVQTALCHLYTPYARLNETSGVIGIFIGNEFKGTVTFEELHKTRHSPGKFIEFIKSKVEKTK